jgi:hypothetical protein
MDYVAHIGLTCSLALIQAERNTKKKGSGKFLLGANDG